MNTTQADMRTPTTPSVGIAGGWTKGPLRGLAVISVVLTLTGCGTYGEPLLLAAMFDNADHCQQQNWHRNGGKAPEYCGASRNRAYIYTPQGNQIGYTKK